LAQAASQG